MIAAALDDTAAQAALFQLGPNWLVPTLEMKLSFHVGVRPGLYHTWGDVVRLGKQITFLKSELRDCRDVLLASLSATSIVTPLKKP